jgi:hypothetical protein
MNLLDLDPHLHLHMELLRVTSACIQSIAFILTFFIIDKRKNINTIACHTNGFRSQSETGGSTVFTSAHVAISNVTYETSHFDDQSNPSLDQANSKLLHVLRYYVYKRF